MPRRRAKRTRQGTIEKPAIRMRLIGNELHCREVCYCTDFVSDADEAIRLLRAGKEIWLQQYAPLCNRVQRVVEGRSV